MSTQQLISLNHIIAGAYITVHPGNMVDQVQLAIVSTTHKKELAQRALQRMGSDPDKMIPLRDAPRLVTYLKDGIHEAVSDLITQFEADNFDCPLSVPTWLDRRLTLANADKRVLEAQLQSKEKSTNVYGTGLRS